MGNVKNWLMEMEEDFYNLSKDEFVKKHGIRHYENFKNKESEEEQQAIAEFDNFN
jgi:hypothetical protein